MLSRPSATRRIAPLLQHHRTLATAAEGRKVVLVEGQRTPFCLAGTHFKDLLAHDLQRYAIHGLLVKTAIDPTIIDRVICGTVIQECKTSNIAREAALGAGIPDSVPAHTVTMACISSNMAVTTGIDMIKANNADIIVAGGTETMSDVPIRFSYNLRKAMLASQKVKHPAGYAKLLAGLGLKDLAPELPAIAEFSTNETMGKSSDRLAAKFGVSREDQDRFALRSHHLAAKAIKDGILEPEITPVSVPPKFKVIDEDNGARGDAKYEKLASLKPAFIKPHGTHTAANSSFLTDGGSAALIMSEEKCRELGYTPKSHLKDYVFVSQDPKEELLLGPAYGAYKILKRNNLTLNDIDVFEFHEAFAGQVLSNLAAMNSDEFAKRAGYAARLGEPDMDKFNIHGGSLSIGHPFGATGCRLLTTASNRLKRENGRLALIAACAAGGQGHAMLVESI